MIPSVVEKLSTVHCVPCKKSSILHSIKLERCKWDNSVRTQRRTVPTTDRSSVNQSQGANRQTSIGFNCDVLIIIINHVIRFVSSRILLIGLEILRAIGIDWRAVSVFVSSKRGLNLGSFHKWDEKPTALKIAAIEVGQRSCQNGGPRAIHPSIYGCLSGIGSRCQPSFAEGRQSNHPECLRVHREKKKKKWVTCRLFRSSTAHCSHDNPSSGAKIDPCYTF